MKRKHLLDLIATGITVGLYKLGEVTGKALHDLIAYEMPYQALKNETWFNYTQYVNLYQKVSGNLDALLGSIFGVVYAGLWAASYLSIRFKLRDYEI
jgi:hypothetical protein